VAIFVVNEWLWADLSGANGVLSQREAFKFVERFPSTQHQIVVIEGSAFDQKAWALCKNNNPIVQRIAAVYVTALRQDQDRCLILAAGSVNPLPHELAAVIKPDDRYLVEAQLSVPGSILVTTDNPLREVLGRAGIKSISRDEFLEAYL
jgi:hypothetical protein